MLYPLLKDNQPNVRTQISLTRTIKRAVEAKSRLLGESLSEYLRRAAVIRLMAEEDEEAELKQLAKNVIGTTKWRKDHPNWPNRKAVRKWLRDIRAEWGERS